MLLALCLAGPADAAGVLLVDAARGSQTGNGSAAAPFASIGQCVDAAVAGTTCLVRGGTYPEMIVPPHDGVTIEGAPGETVIVTTGDRLRNWSESGGGVYAASVVLAHAIPAAHPGQFWPGDALYVDGGEVAEAQWPAPAGDRLQPNWATIASVPVADNKGAAATITDPSAPAFSSPGNSATIHIWSGSDPYAEYEGAVLSAPGGQITYLPNGAFESNFAQAGGRYYVTGAAELLTTDTWFYDAQTHLLHWKTPPGVDPNRSDVRVKQRPATVDLSGRSGITLRNLTLFGGGVVMDKNSQGNVLDAIDARYLSDTLRPHTLSPSDNVDLFDFGILLDGTGNVLRNSRIAHSSQNGVTLHGTDNRVSNVLVHDTDTFGDGAAGILIGDYAADVVRPVVEWSTLYRSGGSDIAISTNSRPGKTQGSPPPPPPYSVTGMEIAHNALSSALWLHTDGGALYACCRNVTTGTRIHDNWIHADIAPAMTDTPAGQSKLSPYAGLYYDNGIGGVTMSRNVVWNSFPDIFIHGNGTADQPTLDVTVSRNSTPDLGSSCNVQLSNIVTADAVGVAQNRVLFSPYLNNTAQDGIALGANGPSEPGAGEDREPGCGFSGCTIGGRPPTDLPRPGLLSPLPPVCTKPAPVAAADAAR